MKKKFFYLLTALFIFVIVTIVNVGMSYFDSMALRERRIQGNMSHAMISDTTIDEMFAIQQQIDTLEYVKSSAMYFHAANVINELELNVVLACVGWGWQDVFVPAFNNLTGNYPRQANEIMTSHNTLELMGIANPEIGMEIILSYSLLNTGEITEATFVLSGFFTDYTYQNGANIIFCSLTFYEQTMLSIDRALHTHERNIMFVVFTNTANISGYIERLRHDFNLTENQVNISQAFDENTDFGNERLFVMSVTLEIYIVSGIFVLILIVITEIISAKKRKHGGIKSEQ
jgi:putative ABC transport system permease protein